MDNQISVYKQLNIKGDKVEITGLNIFQISSSDTTVQGLKFTNPNPAAQYRGSVSGNAISISYQSNILIDNCSFINYHSGVYLSGVRDSNITNSYFTGVTTGVVPDSSDSGTKALNIMGSSNLYITNNTFEGQILDGVSIASTSSNIYVENNTFINNTYGIYYGGASTEGNIIRNNRFITCGMINTTYYSSGLKRNVTVDYSNLPVISLQKASSNIKITDNTFIVKDGNLLILSEAENTAHGFPSVIGGIDLTGNTVQKADSDVNGSTVTFYHIDVLQSLGISPVGDINVKNNNFTGIPDIQSFKINFAQIHVDDNGNVYIPQAKTTTKMTVTYVKDGRVVIELTSSDDREIEGAKITYTLNSGENIIDTTDEFGHIYINGLTGETKIKAKYAGSSIYGDSSLETTIQAGSVQAATKITASALTVYAANAKGTKYQFTLKDADGNAVANQDVSVTFNGKIYQVKTQSNGAAAFTLPTNAAGKYDITMAFTGTSIYKGSVAASTITIQKQATKLTAAKKTFKKKATKKLTATLKADGKAVKGKLITFKVNGKTYKAKTNAKGVATVKIKLTKKGTFTYTAKFAGDSNYKAVSKTNKIKVK